MLKIGYLLSSQFPYHLLVSPDAGPAIAEEYSWWLTSITEIADEAFDAVVVDNRHHGFSELRRLWSSIIKQPKIHFILRVNDPYFFHRNDLWYKFCDALIDAPNIHLLSPYQSTGIVSQWLSCASKSRFIYAPFTYEVAQELKCSHTDRLRRMAVSGNQRRDLYPLRFWIQRASKFGFARTLLCTERLDHPGYPEKVPALHTITGSHYIKWLSNHRAAFTDSSIYRVELLKYREIAYAGCAPVGDLPWSLFDCPKQAFFHYRSLTDLARLRGILRDPDETQAVAVAYRRFLRELRCRTLWREKVTQVIASLF